MSEKEILVVICHKILGLFVTSAEADRTLTMLYDAVLHKPVAKLLCLFPRGGLTFLDQPVQELRRHEGALILDPFLFPGLQQCVFRAHQPGRKEGNKNKPTQRENSSFEILHPWFLRSITAKLLDRCACHVLLQM